MAEQNIFAELQRRQDKYADLPKAMRDWLFTLSPEELEAFDASSEFADQEMMAEVQRQLPEELRFGGKYGLLSALGYYGDGNPENFAGIKAFFTPGGGLTSLVGEYMRPESPNPPLVDTTSVLEFVDPSNPPRRGKDIAVFHGNLGRSSRPKERAYMSPEGYKSSTGEVTSLPRVVAHELQHKGLDSPVVRRFLEEKGETPIMSARKQHDFIDAANNPEAPFARSLNLPKYDDFIEELTEFITPEIAEEYGIRMPIRSLPPEEPPSNLEKIIDFIRGR